MQKIIAYILFFIFSISTFTSKAVIDDCCAVNNAKHTMPSHCKKSCCTKEKKSIPKHAHKCCQVIAPNQLNYAVSNTNNIVVEASVSSKKIHCITYSYSFQNLFEKPNSNYPIFFKQHTLQYAPKHYIQYCSYLI
ncbi:MAG TPA: hypothetical protein PKG56_06200 [Chitinophagaceae bacterium]|nr:hypothetical protein [Chitinophagaceae bacterium]HMZ46184.1 hypothetical protein [Chitinophagaceae bacterium]HNF30059.1 hypothetical protein [Chitinophagaceae bacterium]HNJ57584.1 hypothetical protein [Chitinophagaceae bacterium]HNL82969.1 hypothetical protein [Chitinophagaceae bacterium]